MRMMKNNNNETVMVIGIDHGYGNMKTATRCFPSGVARYDKESIFQNNLLVYNTGVYMAEPIADITAVIFTSVLFTFQFKKALAEIQN